MGKTLKKLLVKKLKRSLKNTKKEDELLVSCIIILSLLVLYLYIVDIVMSTYIMAHTN